MPGRGTHQVTLRVPEDLWIVFGEAAVRAGTDRSAIMRELIRWYTRQAGAKLPDRP